MTSHLSKAPWILALAFLMDLVNLGAAAEHADQATAGAHHDVPPLFAVVRASDRFINLLVERHITRQQYTQEYLLGAFTSGPVLLDGTVVAELVPDPRHISIDIRLVGTTECRNHIGERGPVTISSSAAGQIDVRKRVLVDLTGVQTEPATAQCTASVQIHDIEAQRRLIERIAWRRAKRMHGEIEQAAAQTSGIRTEQQLDQELLAPLTEADKVLNEKFGDAISSKKLQKLPFRVNLSTTRSAVQAAVVADDGSQVFQPKLLQSHWDLILAIHQSCFDQLAQAAFAGKTIEDATFLDAMQTVTGSSPRALWVHDRAERWSVVLANEHPVTGRFDDDHCALTLRLQQVHCGARRLSRPLEVSAQYLLEITPDGPHFVRDGELHVRFSSEEPASEEDESLRRFAYKKLSGLFRPEIYFDGLVPPVGGSLGKLRVLQLRALSSRDGWLSIGYQLPLDREQVVRLAE